MNPKKKFYETAAETLIKNLDKRGMEAYYVDNGEEALKMAELYGCKRAILKERSPSCGCGIIYDGSFSRQTVPGNGVTAELLLNHGISVFGESVLED